MQQTFNALWSLATRCQRCSDTLLVPLLPIPFASRIEALGQFDTGAGNTYNLQVTQDVWLERGSRNYNNHQYLIVGTHPHYPLKRSLLQFEDLPSTCIHVHWAKMYVHFAYAHKASFMSVTQVPYISRPLQVHQVL
ncbi:hypothetical protein GBAR_LOCUS16220 [Geodia barretti]|uniref:Uncharacterized protein n=1 Tax=Geodia barretti TaxID=519541 RepID=A0AA35SGW1_GEOBA|nr:hypothetical protein GBAR_LOCUS16220 [Geodia barretti]